LDGWTALHFAVNEGYEEIVDFLIKNHANVESKTSFSRRPIHIAALRGNLQIFELLL
jgi:ankyrin repeat protein